jgi:glycosyltransferase involved in cell wall biosynthesis
MKILHIFDDYGTPGEKALPGIGSVPSVVYYLAKYTAKKGHDVTILERGHDKNDPDEEYIDGIGYVRLRAEKLPAAPYKLIKSPTGLMRLFSDSMRMALKIDGYIKNNNDFDVVHVHFPFSACMLVNINRRVREKIVYTAHIGEEKKRFGLDSKTSPLLKLFSPDLYLMKRVKKGVVLNDNLKSMLVAKGLEENKLEAIPNGVDVNEFDVSRDEIERVKEKYGLNGITVMFAGTITPRKGVDCLVKSAEIILRDFDVTFLLVGNLKLDEEFANRIVKYVKDKGLDRNIRFTGFVPYEDLKALYSACDIFVLPSLEEGHGIVLTEALASGKPLVGSNVGGIPMQIREGWNGFLVEPGNEKQLAEKIKYLVENKEERKRMGRNSRRLAVEEFSWEIITEKYLKVYRELMT